MKVTYHKHGDFPAIIYFRTNKSNVIFGIAMTSTKERLIERAPQDVIEAVDNYIAKYKTSWQAIKLQAKYKKGTLLDIST